MLSWREVLKQTAVFSALSVVAIAGTIALLWRASDSWAATHGYGTPGRWTATRDAGGRSLVHWYGDFVPDDGGPVRHDVPMDGPVDPAHGTRTVTAVYRAGTAYLTPGTGQWLPLALVATVPLTAAVSMVWLITRIWRRRPRHVSARPLTPQEFGPSPRSFLAGAVTDHLTLIRTDQVERDTVPHSG